MSPEKVDKAAKRVRALVASDDHSEAVEQELKMLTLDLALGAARNLAVLAAGK